MTEKLDLIWGARRIADTLGVPEHRVTRLFDKGQLPFVRRVGKMLVAEMGEVRKHFISDHRTAGGTTTPAATCRTRWPAQRRRMCTSCTQTSASTRHPIHALADTRSRRATAWPGLARRFTWVTRGADIMEGQ